MKKKSCYGLVVFTILASLMFFRPSFLPIANTQYKFVFYLSATILFIVTYGHKDNKHNGEHYKIFKYIIILLSVCQLISAYNAFIYKDQDFIVSLIATMQGFAFCLYLPLRKAKLPISWMERIMRSFAGLFIIVTLLNFISPEPLFGSADEGLDRGITRFRIYGVDWCLIYMFLCVQRYSETMNKKHLWWIVITGIAILLTLTRQVIAVSCCVGVLLFMKNAKLVKKVWVVCIIGVVYFSLVPHMGFVNRLIDKTRDEIAAQSQYENIRLVAFDYFVFEYPRNTQQVLFGVGIPAFGKSDYGNSYERTVETMRLFREDVGWAGFYYNHGLIATIILLLVFVIAMFVKIDGRYSYLKYFLFSEMVLSITSAPILENNEIMVIVFALAVLTHAGVCCDKLEKQKK